jgi:CO/xanthine dehydrogenase Mo-binding subunit
MPTRLIGQNYTTPDLVAKVTGRARYAEDYRADGMLFCKLLLSPMPHCRVTRLDTARALAIPGVKAILTADEMPAQKVAEGALAPEAGLTNEPPPRRSTPSASSSRRCRSSSIRWPACGPAAPTPGSRAMRSSPASWRR